MRYFGICHFFLQYWVPPNVPLDEILVQMELTRKSKIKLVLLYSVNSLVLKNFTTFFTTAADVVTSIYMNCI